MKLTPEEFALLQSGLKQYSRELCRHANAERGAGDVIGNKQAIMLEERSTKVVRLLKKLEDGVEIES